MDSSKRRHRGLLTGADMAAWRASIEVRRAMTITTIPSSNAAPGAGAGVPAALALLKDFDLAAMDPLGPGRPYGTECAKLALADREAYYGDPDFVDVPCPSFWPTNTTRARKLVTRRASHDCVRRHSGFANRSSHPRGGGMRTKKQDESAGTGEPTAKRGDTCISNRPTAGGQNSLGHASGRLAAEFARHSGLVLPRQPGPDVLAGTRPSRKPWRRASARAPAVAKPAFKADSPISPSARPAAITRINGPDLLPAPCSSRHEPAGIHRRPMFHTDHMPSSFWPRKLQPASLTAEPDAARPSRPSPQGPSVTVSDDWSQGRLAAVARSTGC